MWTIDTRCSQCGKKENCKDRGKLIGALSPLTNDLNTAQEHVESAGDGVLIIMCRDFGVGA